MIIIVGLGNPGKKYEKTRHNLGFRIVDQFQRENNFPKFEFKKEFCSLISEGKFNNEKIILAKPQTFINLSGKAIKFLILSHSLKKLTINAMASIVRYLGNLWVVHDDIDLPLGKIRISIGRGSAGHKGVESIIKELKTKNFIRFRVGIHSKTGKPKNVESFVLQKFNKEEKRIVKEVIEKTVRAIEVVIKEGLEKAMSRYNK